MPVIQRRVSIGAGAVNDNLLSGSAFEFARSRQLVSLAIAQEVTGMFAGLTSGSDIIAEEFEPIILAVGVPILIPDHMFYTDYMEPADRLVVRVRNPTAGAIFARTLVQVSPVA